MQGVYSLSAVKSINIYAGWYSVLSYSSVIAVGVSYEQDNKRTLIRGNEKCAESILLCLFFQNCSWFISG